MGDRWTSRKESYLSKDLQDESLSTDRAVLVCVCVCCWRAEEGGGDAGRLTHSMGGRDNKRGGGRQIGAGGEEQCSGS